MSDQQRKASKRKSEDMRGVTQFAPFPQNVIHAVTTRLFFAIVKTDAQIRQMKHRDEPEAETADESHARADDPVSASDPSEGTTERALSLTSPAQPSATHAPIHVRTC